MTLCAAHWCACAILERSIAQKHGGEAAVRAEDRVFRLTVSMRLEGEKQLPLHEDSQIVCGRNAFSRKISANSRYRTLLAEKS